MVIATSKSTKNIKLKAKNRVYLFLFEVVFKTKEMTFLGII